MTKKRADKKDELIHLPNETAPIKQSLQLAPLQISIDKSFQPPHETAPIRRQEHEAQVMSARDLPAQRAEEPAAVKEPNHVQSLGPGLQDEVKAIDTPRETVVNAKKFLRLDRDRRLHEGRKRGPRPSKSKIFTKSSDMGHSANKRVYLALIISLSLSVIGGLYIVGLLQSTESVNAYGLVVQHWAEESETVYAGDSHMRRETFYIKNTNDEAVTLSFTTENWGPPEASEYIGLSWDWEEINTLEPGYVCKVTVTLVDRSITGMGDYSFDIVFIASSP